MRRLGALSVRGRASRPLSVREAQTDDTNHWAIGGHVSRYSGQDAWLIATWNAAVVEWKHYRNGVKFYKMSNHPIVVLIKVNHSQPLEQATVSPVYFV